MTVSATQSSRGGGVGLRLLTHAVRELRKAGRVLEQSAVLEHQALDRGL